jgi:DNA-binding GntR family transcriptional regulator
LADLRYDERTLRRQSGPQSSSLAAEAYTIIRERILRGEVAVGHVISRRRVATELAMSLLPVSEAFLQLEFEGLLESRPRAGTRVRIPNRADVEGHYVVREALEIQAARLCSRFATADERSALMKLAVRVDTMASQAETDRAVYLSTHEKLHHQIAEYGRCPALCDAIEKTCAFSSIWLCMGPNFADEHSSPNRHQELVEALGKGDPHLAAEAMRRHIASSRESMLRRLEPFFALGNTSDGTYKRSRKKAPLDAMVPTTPVQ